VRAYRFAVRYRWWLIGALATFFFVFAGYEISILPEAIANKCKQPDSASKNYCAGYIVAGASLDIVAGFLKPYSDVLTALSGIAVAAFTFTLWLTTRQMWRVSVAQIAIGKKAAEAAEKSADAVPNVERAYIFIEPEFGSPGASRIIINYTGDVSLDIPRR
jgi:hypothetical protein